MTNLGESHVASKYSQYVSERGERPLDVAALRRLQRELFLAPPSLDPKAPPPIAAAQLALVNLFEAVKTAPNAIQIQPLADETVRAIDTAIESTPPGFALDSWARTVMDHLIP